MTVETEEKSNSNERQDATAALFGFPATSRSKLEQTLCLIKPDAIEQADEILKILQDEGFSVLKTRRLTLSPEEAAQFYDDLGDTERVSHLSKSEVMAILLSGPGAIQHLHEVLGPETHEHRQQYPGCLRNRFGTQDSDVENGLHGSASEGDALRDLNFFFPEFVVDPIVADSLSSYYTNDNVHPVLMVGLAQLLRESPSEPLLWLANWLTNHNPNKSRGEENPV